MGMISAPNIKHSVFGTKRITPQKKSRTYPREPVKRRGEVLSATATASMTSRFESVTFIPRPQVPMEISNSWKGCMVTCYVTVFWPVMSQMFGQGLAN